VSSANLVQKFEATWSNAQLESHLDAGKIIDRVRQDAFLRAAAFVREGKPLTEYDLQQWIADQFRANGLLPEATIVAVQPTTATRTTSQNQTARARFALETCCSSTCGRSSSAPGACSTTSPGWVTSETACQTPTRKYLASSARRADNAVELVKEAVAEGRSIHGWEVDPRRSRDDSQSRLREIFCPSHRPQHRRKYSRQRRKHGQPRDSRRP